MFFLHGVGAADSNGTGGVHKNINAPVRCDPQTFLWVPAEIPASADIRPEAADGTSAGRSGGSCRGHGLLLEVLELLLQLLFQPGGILGKVHSLFNLGLEDG